MSRIFGEIRQIAYVTRDIRKAIAFFVETAGIGPWFLSEGQEDSHATYRGAPCTARTSVAMANSGFIQLKIVQPMGEAPSVHGEWLARHPDELLIQHFSTWPEDFDEAYQAARALGYEPVQEGRPQRGPFAFFQHPERPEFIVEMTELTAARRAMWENIAAAAQGWDGTDPIRVRPLYAQS